MSSAWKLNLSSAPFVNRRPVRRLTITLWVVGALLLLLNVYLIWSHRAETVEGRAELAETRAQAAREVEITRLLRDELSSMDLSAQNEHVDFLNQRIAQRAFPWSRLFEQLAEVMPAGVRLRSLFPGLDDRRGSRRRRTVLDTRVRLTISAQAESGETMLEFVDRLFAHPAFDRPNLQRESTKGSITGFELDVLYQPDFEGDEPPNPSEQATLEEVEREPEAASTRVGGGAR